GTSCTGNAGPISPAAAQDKTAAASARPRRGHPLPAADNFLPERDPGSACRH
ncbi:unnamed protein product, partial [Ascophyllum nodosum]